MTNIPTDLLRTLVAVVDMRSFTKAAASLGVTQPAVSSKIKRLQFLLGDELFDRSTQGVSLTPHGEIVVSYARRMLSINDQIVHLGDVDSRPELVIRIGTPSDLVASLLPGILAPFRARWPDVRFSVCTDHYESLVRAFRISEIDLFTGLSTTQPHDARHSWLEEVVWVRSAATQVDPDRPVPLVSHGEPCIYHRLAVTALKSAGLEWESVFTGSSMTSLNAAVRAGLGVLATTSLRADSAGIFTWDNAPLPKMPDLYRGIYIREGGARAAYEQLADDIAAVFTGLVERAPALVAVKESSAA